MILLDAAGRAFVGRRIDTAEPAWQLPQGGIDGEESAAAAARRELAEEIGTDRFRLLAESAGWYAYDLPDDLVGKVWGGCFRGQRQKWFACRFTGRDSDIDLDGPHAEFSDWRWVAPETLPGLAVPFKRPLYEAVLAEFAPLLR